MKVNRLPFINPASCAVKLRAMVVGTAILTVLGGSVFASTSTPTPAPIIIPVKPKVRVTVDSRPERNVAALQAALDLRAPSNPANLIQGVTTSRIVERLRDIQGGGATAGAGSGKEVKETKEVAPPEGPKFSVFGEYSYLTSNDHRREGSDSITNSGTGGFDVTFNKTLAGLIYAYSHASGASDFLKSNTSSDSNFVSVYVAQSLTDYLSVGVTGGYGHTEIDSFIRDPNFPTLETDVRTNTYSASPFVSLSYAHDNFYASLTTAFQYLHTGSNASDQLNVTLVGGYQFASWISGEISGKFTQSLHNTQKGLPEDDNWFSVGPKLKEYITPRLVVYEAYELNINETFTQHMFTGGVSYSF